MPVRRVDEQCSRSNHDQDDGDLDHDNDGVHGGRFAHADDEEQRDGEGDHDRRNIEDSRDRIAAGDRDDAARRSADRRRKAEAELLEQGDEIAGPADRHRRGAERILEDQIPADHPGNELTECRVGVGIR